MEPVQIAYNSNESAPLQLLEVATQKQSDVDKDFWRYISNLSFAPKWFQDLALEVIQKYDRVHYILDKDLKTQVGGYRKRLEEGSSVLIVAHSQGHFYANAAFELLGNLNQRMAIVGAAAPVESIAGSGFYTTLTQDKVMMAVRLIFGALLANVTNSKSSFWGHDFEEYLSGDKSGPKIVANISNQLKILSDADQDSDAAFSNPRYLDEGLIPMWKWTRQIGDLRRKLSVKECVAVSAFMKVYDWFGDKCEDRSVRGIGDWMHDCQGDLWKDTKDRFDFFACSLFGVPSSFLYNSASLLEATLSNHDECRLSAEKVGQVMNPGFIGDVLSFIREPH